MQTSAGIGVVPGLPTPSPAPLRPRSEGRPNGGVDALFAAHADELRRYAERIVHTRDAAEDVVQDVFLRLWLARDRVELGGAIRGYLYMSTRARAIDALRRARRDERGARGVDVQDDVDGRIDPGADGADDAGERDWTAAAGAVLRVLAAMPPRQRRVATLRLYDRRSTADVARELRISPRTVEAHYARAMKVLRAELPRLLQAGP